MSETTENAQPRMMERIRLAVELAEENQDAEALSLLLALVAEFPREALAHAYLGWVFSRIGRHREAIEQGRAAIQLDPASERASLLLFRILWSSGEPQLALGEMKRYVTIGNSEEYTRVMMELNEIGS
jgi:predicted Zn-dependent protease